MLTEFGTFIWDTLRSALNMMNSSSVWMIVSFAIAGLLHEFLSPERMRKSAIGTDRPAGVFWTTIWGMLVPICSCGTIPLGISLYYSGACLGPTLAFMTASPMINPIAILLCWGLLGKEITVIYVLTGFFAPMLIGLVANRFAGSELRAPGLDGAPSPAIALEEESRTIWQKLVSGLHWSFNELAMTVSKYGVTGMLIAGLIFNIFPQSAIQTYLGNPGFISLFGITVIAALMYVCAVGHIPFIAALVASGAAPGVAITFLMAGAATNIPELLTITKTIGKRAMLLYFGMVVTISNLVGFLANRLLMPFTPVLDFDAAQNTISAANKLIFTAPEWLQLACSLVMIAYACQALVQWIRPRFRSRAQAV